MMKEIKEFFRITDIPSVADTVIDEQYIYIGTTDGRVLRAVGSDVFTLCATSFNFEENQEKFELFENVNNFIMEMKIIDDILIVATDEEVCFFNKETKEIISKIKDEDSRYCPLVSFGDNNDVFFLYDDKIYLCQISGKTVSIKVVELDIHGNFWIYENKENKIVVGYYYSEDDPFDWQFNRFSAIPLDLENNLLFDKKIALEDTVEYKFNYKNEIVLVLDSRKILSYNNFELKETDDEEIIKIVEKIRNSAENERVICLQETPESYIAETFDNTIIISKDENSFQTETINEDCISIQYHDEIYILSCDDSIKFYRVS